MDRRNFMMGAVAAPAGLILPKSLTEPILESSGKSLKDVKEEITVYGNSLLNIHDELVTTVRVIHRGRYIGDFFIRNMFTSLNDAGLSFDIDLTSKELRRRYSYRDEINIVLRQ